jgi:hypothetical protein
METPIGVSCSFFKKGETAFCLFCKFQVHPAKSRFLLFDETDHFDEKEES